MAKKIYIDKDLLVQTIAFHELGKDLDDSIDSCGSEYLTIIDNQPAADVAEVKHGEWNKADYYTREWDGDYANNVAFSCSCCKVCVTGYNKTNYCPNCGARMDGSY